MIKNQKLNNNLFFFIFQLPQSTPPRSPVPTLSLGDKGTKDSRMLLWF